MQTHFLTLFAEQSIIFEIYKFKFYCNKLIDISKPIEWKPLLSSGARIASTFSPKHSRPERFNESVSKTVALRVAGMRVRTQPSSLTSCWSQCRIWPTCSATRSARSLCSRRWATATSSATTTTTTATCTATAWPPTSSTRTSRTCGASGCPPRRSLLLRKVSELRIIILCGAAKLWNFNFMKLWIQIAFYRLQNILIFQYNTNWKIQ